MDNLKQVLRDAVLSGNTLKVKEILRMEPEFLFQFFEIFEMYFYLAENGTREHLEWFDNVLIRYKSSVEIEVRKELENAEPLGLRNTYLPTVWASPQHDDEDEKELRIEKMVYERIYKTTHTVCNHDDRDYCDDECEESDETDHLHYEARMQAASNKSADVMKYLIKKVKEVIEWERYFNDCDAWHLERVHYYELDEVLKNGGEKVAQLLIDPCGCFKNDSHADFVMDIVDKSIREKNIDVIKFLHKNNFSTNFIRSDGRTSLMLCVEYERIKFLKILLSNSADTKLRNKDNQTPYKFARDLLKEKVKNALKVSLDDVTEELLEKYIKDHPKKSRGLTKLYKMVKILENVTPEEGLC